MTRPSQARQPAAAAAGASPIASVDKALRVLEQLANTDMDGIGLTSLANQLSLNKASLHHTLSALRLRGWVEQNPDGTYALGPATATLAHWWTSPDRLVQQLHPVLERLSNQAKELVQLGRLSERSILYLDKVEPERPIRVYSRIGHRLPVAMTAMGRAIIGATEGESLDPHTWVELVDSPPPNLAERLRQESRRVADHGFAIEFSENQPGVGCVGVPLQVSGQICAAISITAPMDRLSLERAANLARTIHTEIQTAHLPQISLVHRVADGSP